MSDTTRLGVVTLCIPLAAVMPFITAWTALIGLAILATAVVLVVRARWPATIRLVVSVIVVVGTVVLALSFLILVTVMSGD